MNWFHSDRRLDQAYAIGIAIKGLDGVLEVATGLLLLVISPDTINHVARLLTQHELSTDPHDVIGNAILHSGQHLASGGTTFAVAYLLIHGVIKVAVVVALWLDKLWAYPLALVTLGLFLVYQAYLLGVGPTLGLILLTAFDAAVLWLIWREYLSRRRRRLAVPLDQLKVS